MLAPRHILASAALAVAALLPLSASAVEYVLPDLSDGWLQLEHDGAPWGGVNGCQGFGGTVCDVPAGGPYKLIDLSDGGRALMRGINVAGGASSEPAEPFLPSGQPAETACPAAWAETLERLATLPRSSTMQRYNVFGDHMGSCSGGRQFVGFGTVQTEVRITNRGSIAYGAFAAHTLQWRHDVREGSSHWESVPLTAQQALSCAVILGCTSY